MTTKYAIYCAKCGDYIGMGDEKSFTKLCDKCLSEGKKKMEVKV
jgi:NMD protein affecting ribosome stability and mRNA decay